MRKVVIAQHRLLHYRETLFDRMRQSASAVDIDLHLLHGGPTRREKAKNDCGALPWADVADNHVLEIGGRDLLWQPFPGHLRDADLVVLMQESRLISNYPWLFGLHNRKTRVAFWGHGRNFQSTAPNGVREWWKRKHIGMVDWWFAYTELTREILLNDRYPESRISVLNNAIDNLGFARDLAAVDDEQLNVLRAPLSLAPDAEVGLFCGSLYPDKRLEFLIESADRIKQARPRFALIVIGDGPSAETLRTAAMDRNWLHPVGAKKGVEKAGYFRLSSIILNPGLVGLHVLDAFCAGRPMVTTSDARHSPEIAYLQDGLNGLIVTGGVEAYSDAVIALLDDQCRLGELSTGAKSSSERYTLDSMVETFVDGMQRCLAMPRLRWGNR